MSATSPRPGGSVTGDRLARLADHDTGTVSDALDSLHVRGAVGGLVRLTTGATVVGVAVTVQLGPADGRPSDRHLGAAALAAADDRAVVVVAGGRGDGGGGGGLLSRAARVRGVRGVVLDGACRDVDEAEALGFPVFARRSTPVTARGRQREIDSGNPVTIDGVHIAPGDFVVADGSGVVVVPSAAADEVLAAADRIAARERAMIARLDAGESPADVIGRNYETMLSREAQ